MAIAMLASALLLSHQLHEPPRRLTELATELRRSGAEVVVSDADGNGWEVWFEAVRPIRDASLVVLESRAHLHSVRLLAGGFGDAGVAHLKGLPDLHTLVLVSDRLTDRCTEPLSRLKGLIKLDLNRASLTKVGLERLARLPKLQRLYLYNARVHEADFRVLKSFKRLKVLSLPKSVSDKLYDEIRRSLPSTDVDRI